MLKFKLSILQMYFVSGKYRKSILEVYLKYTEIVQGLLQNFSLQPDDQLLFLHGMLLKLCATQYHLILEIVHYSAHFTWCLCYQLDHIL